MSSTVCYDPIFRRHGVDEKKRKGNKNRMKEEIEKEVEKEAKLESWNSPLVVG